MAEETVAPGSRRSSRLAPGRILGPYRIERQIGRGGMSVVYAATHIPLDRLVALKILLPSLSGDREFVERFLAEAQSAARLDYPHIVPVYDTGEIGGVNFIAMKLLEGKDLKSVLAERREEQQGGLPLDRAISIASQAAGALEYAHQHRVVHRDVKPANIYVDGNDRVTLVDFGIARALDRSSTTLTGTVIGTPTYMSPEQAQGRTADYRSDIYSLGVVAYEMFAGAPPFTGQPQAVMHAHVYREPPPLSSLRQDVPRGVSDVVQRALAKDPEARFQTAGAVALAMTNASGGQLARQALEPSLDGASSGSRSGSYTSPSIAEDGRAGAPATRARFLSGRLIVSTSVAIVALAGLLAWALIAGPLGASGGRILVSSEPAGASVTVDGIRLGTTPLDWQRVGVGAHELILDKPGYVQVKRTERIGARDSDSVNATLTPLPASDLLDVQLAVLAKDVGTDANGTITAGNVVNTVRVGEEFGMIVTLAPKAAAQRDVGFHYEFALFDPSGKRLGSSPTTSTTVARGNTTGQSFAFTFTFNASSFGTYQLQFLIDGQALVTRPITLSQ